MNWNELFEYIPHSSGLQWKASRSPWLNGTVAGSINSRGYWVVSIGGVKKKTHVIVWEMHHGPTPQGFLIDHKDGDKLCNLIENLRPATRSQNCWNAAKPKTNTSGHKGICWNKKSQLWQVQIKVNRRPIYGGCFQTIEDAIACRDRLAASLHGQFARA